MRYRRDGFTAEKRRRFLKTLAKTGCWRDAARKAPISTTSADRWRNKDPEFARLCEVALHKAASHIEVLAWERAVTGIEEPVIHYGKVVGTRIRRSDSIFRLLLIGSDRKKYGRMGAVGRKRLEKEERARIEREVRAHIAAKRRPEAQVRESILTKLKAIHEHKIRYEGYTEGPGGRLVPPGWKMVWTGEGPPPEGDEGEEGDCG